MQITIVLPINCHTSRQVIHVYHSFDVPEHSCCNFLGGVRDLELLVLGEPGGRLNKKDGLTRYGNSHVKDKTS